MRLILLIPVFGILLSGAGVAQEARLIDLSGLAESVGHETPDGSMIEAYSCIGPRTPIPQNERTSVEWMQTTDLYPHQRVEVEFRVENIGTTLLRLPIHPSLTDLRPKDLAATFEFYRMTLPLVALVAAKGSALEAGGLELYGSVTRPDTLLTLKPGESIRVRGDVEVLRWYKRDQPITVSTDLKLSKHAAPPSKIEKINPSNQRCNLERSEGTPLNAFMHAEPQR